jgi:TatD DNase family protein
VIDSHCHLADEAFAPDREEAVSRARAAGVVGIVVVAEGLASADAARALCAGRTGLWPTAGIHPHRASEFDAPAVRRLEQLTAEPDVVAVGETGLDYHYDHSPRDRQREAFAWHLARSADTGKPVIVHAREADDDAARLIAEAPAGTTGVLHSFSSGPALLEAGLAKGFCVSFSGMVTFKSWSQHDAVRRVPDERLLAETDAPFLAPVPMRGQRNEPAFVAHTVAKLADIRGTSVERMRELTMRNAQRLFRLHTPTPRTQNP